jgi:virginiamycin B lyase
MMPPATKRRSRRTGVLATLLGCLCALGVSGAGAAPNPSTQTYPLGDSARASGLAIGPDGNLWFAGNKAGGLPGDLVGRITPAGAVTRLPLAPGPAARGGKIALGPDGRLWFTDPDTNQVGRVDTAGQYVLFAIPTAGAEAGEIVAGPGEAMWFVEQAADKVARVDMNGVVTEFPLPAGARPSGIAKGSDGALWITEKVPGRIARMAANGVVTDQYSLLNPAARPHSIVAGPDGNLWFTEEGAPRIGRISVGGTIDEFRIPGANGTRELALGADGNLWFTAGSAIGSISATGQTGEPECIDAACSWPINALAKGPDGELWFATDSAIVPGGGGTQLQSLMAGGLVGKFHAPRLQTRLGKRITAVNDGLTTVAVSCHGGSAGQSCRGWLRMRATQPSREGRRGRATVLLDQRRYRLEPASARRLPLFLGARGRRALARAGGRLAVEVSVTRVDSGATSKRFVLKARRQR